MLDSGIRSLRRELRRLFVAPPPDEAFLAGLGRDLLAAHSGRYGTSIRSRRAFLRPAWVTASIACALAAGALPTADPVIEGTLISLELAPGYDPPAIPELHAVASQATGAEEVSVSVSQGGDGSGRVMVIVLGTGAPAERLIERLRAAFPGLGNAQSAAVVGSVRAALAERLGRRLLGVEVAPARRQRVRQEVLQALLSGGVSGAEVAVDESGPVRTLRVRLPER